MAIEYSMVVVKHVARHHAQTAGESIPPSRIVDFLATDLSTDSRTMNDFLSVSDHVEH